MFVFRFFWVCSDMDKRIEMNQETVMKRRYISAPTDQPE